MTMMMVVEILARENGVDIYYTSKLEMHNPEVTVL